MTPALYEEAGIAMQLSTFESLAPPSENLSRRIKTMVRKALGRPIGVLDTISIGIKQRS